MKRILFAMGIYLLSFGYPTDSVSVTLDRKGKADSLGNCKNLTVQDAKNYSSMRTYKLKGSCYLFIPGVFGGYTSAEIKATFDKSSNKAVETISLLDFGGPVQVISQCNEDPWRVPSASCTKVSFNKASYPNAIYLMHETHSKSEYPLSLSRSAVNAVKDYVNGQLQPLPPRIVQPYSNSSHSYPNKDNLPVVVKYAGVVEQQANGWYEYFQYPEGADTVSLEWQYYYISPIPAPPSGGGNSMNMWQPANVLSETKIGYPPTIDLQGLQEGKYRVKARHKVPQQGWPWTDWREFWVGDPVNYNKPKVSIVLPEKGAIIEPNSTETLIPVEIEVKKYHQGNVLTPPKYRKKVEVELAYFYPSLADSNPDSKKKGWGPDNQTISYVKNELEKFTPYLDPALWRIRARLKVDDNEEYKAPWTPWQFFLVGRIKLHLFDKKQDKLVLDPDVMKKLLDASQAAETRDRGPDRDNAQKPRAKAEPTFDQKPIDLSKLKRILESWVKIKKAEIPASSSSCPSCQRILATIRNLDGKGSFLEREADSLIKKVEGKKVGKEESSQVEKRAGELTREFGDLTSQRKTLVEQYKAELAKANQQRQIVSSRDKRVTDKGREQIVLKQIDLSKLKRSLESWVKIKKAEISKTSAPCPSCDKILASIRDLDTKGSSLEREADSLIKKVEGKKVGKEESSQVEKRAGELTREFGDLTSQRKALVEQYNAELAKANQQRILPKPERKR